MMNAKRLVLCILIVTLYNFSFAQKKEIKSAMQQGKNSSGFYLATFQDKKIIEPEKVRKYCSANNYRIIELKTKEYYSFGELYTVASQLKFIPNNEWNLYQSQVERDFIVNSLKSAKEFKQKFPNSQYTDDKIGTYYKRCQVSDLPELISLFPNSVHIKAMQEKYVLRQGAVKSMISAFEKYPNSIETTTFQKSLIQKIKSWDDVYDFNRKFPNSTCQKDFEKKVWSLITFASDVTKYKRYFPTSTSNFANNGKVTYSGLDYYYEGKTVNNLAHGQGKAVGSEGIYFGQFKNGKPNGNGKFYYAGNILFDGPFSNGLRNGEGKFVFKKDTRKTKTNYGFGSFGISSGGDVTWEGVWIDYEPSLKDIPVSYKFREKFSISKGIATYGTGYRYQIYRYGKLASTIRIDVYRTYSGSDNYGISIFQPFLKKTGKEYFEYIIYTPNGYPVNWSCEISNKGSDDYRYDVYLRQEVKRNYDKTNICFIENKYVGNRQTAIEHSIKYFLKERFGYME